ncbi:MAG: hypothetical protein C0427_13115 [Rhodobacter sp.]|nr:hypothetical protein [Rhodobacter sp.]
MKASLMFRILATRTVRPTRRIRLMHRLAQFHALLRQRRGLATLDDHLLRDIGLTPEQARHEATRPIWDVPAHWRK